MMGVYERERDWQVDVIVVIDLFFCYYYGNITEQDSIFLTQF